MIEPPDRTASPPADSLLDEIRNIYSLTSASDPPGAEATIETYLARRLAGLSPRERLAVMDDLISGFERSRGASSGDADMERATLSKLFSLLLGEDASPGDLSSPELLGRLADSLNTVFDALNKLVGVINITLLGESAEERTIRRVIGSSLEGGSRTETLESHLDQINQAFLITMKALKATAPVLMNKVLQELDPEKISDAGRGFKFGPMRKAEYYDRYADKFALVRKWFDSGRFMHEFMREFEKNCRKSRGK
ncbi:MAG: hypothetical protein GY859_22000 [Desulfobacterales bacterium]|nr:hypothetical protein [Desulfobacterales bacterium]